MHEINIRQNTKLEEYMPPESSRSPARNEQSPIHNLRMANSQQPRIREAMIARGAHDFSPPILRLRGGCRGQEDHDSGEDVTLTRHCQGESSKSQKCSENQKILSLPINVTELFLRELDPADLIDYATTCKDNLEICKSIAKDRCLQIIGLETSGNEEADWFQLHRHLSMHLPPNSPNGELSNLIIGYVNSNNPVLIRSADYITEQLLLRDRVGPPFETASRMIELGMTQPVLNIASKLLDYAKQSDSKIVVGRRISTLIRNLKARGFEDPQLDDLSNRLKAFRGPK